MKYLTLGVVIVAMLLLSCSLPDDEIELVSPKDDAVLNVDNLVKDTFMFREDSFYIITHQIPLQWEMFEGLERYCVVIRTDSSGSCKLIQVYAGVEEMVCVVFNFRKEVGHVSQDGSLVPDTINVHPPFYLWVVFPTDLDGYPIGDGTQSETWSFTVVKN